MTTCFCPFSVDIQCRLRRCHSHSDDSVDMLWPSHYGDNVDAVDMLWPPHLLRLGIRYVHEIIIDFLLILLLIEKSPRSNRILN